MVPDRKPKRKPRIARPHGPADTDWVSADATEPLTDEEKLECPVAEMKLTVRVINTLEVNGILTAGQLMVQTYEALMGFKNFGEKTLNECRLALQALGLTPPTWQKPPATPKIKPKNMYDPWK